MGCNASNTAGQQAAQPSESKGHGLDKSQFIHHSNKKITEIYEVEKKKLGEGSYGSVTKGKHRKTKEVRAVKTIAKSQMKNIDRFMQEIAILKMMDHPNIIKLFETFEDARNIYLVMELCIGGELFDKIIEEGHLTEVNAAQLMKQIIHAVYYMHSESVCHRDLKPENFLLLTRGPFERNVLKVIDFGLSRPFQAGKPMRTVAGSAYYMAPEVISGEYDHLCELWSCGVLMYLFLCGYPPFQGATDVEVLRQVRRGRAKFDMRHWCHISEDGRSLVNELLSLDPRKRPSAGEALGNVWVQEHAPKAPDARLQEGFIDHLRQFRSLNKLKKAVLHIAARQLDEKQLRRLRETFLELDANGDGLLTVAELQEGLKKGGLKDIPADLEQVMVELGSDTGGALEYTEFLAAALSLRHDIQDNVCWAAFRVFDRNGDGKISIEELREVLFGGAVAEAFGAEAEELRDALEVMKDIDANNDGSIDYEEFVSMLRGSQAGSDHHRVSCDGFLG